MTDPFVSTFILGFGAGLLVGLELARRAYRDCVRAMDEAAVLEAAKKLVADLDASALLGRGGEG